MFDEQRIVSRIESLLTAQLRLSADESHDVAFHMTDWLDDLAAWAHFCNEPDSLDDSALEDLLCTFLLHVPQHVAAAAKLYTGDPVTDVFGVGATVSDRYVPSE